MERFARIIVGYHGCSEEFAHAVLLGEMPIEQWQPSRNDWDWLGHGIYFWEHSPYRALRWAQEKFDRPAVIGSIIQLGKCFDLMDESVTFLLADEYRKLAMHYQGQGKPLPGNSKGRGKLRRLDCLVINDCLNGIQNQGVHYDTVRGAFWEGTPVFPGGSFFRETHIQVAVRNSTCILGVFRPNL